MSSHLHSATDPFGSVEFPLLEPRLFDEAPLWKRIIGDQSLRLGRRSGVECDQSSRAIGERPTQVVGQPIPRQ